MKKLITFLLSTMLILSMVTVSVSAESQYTTIEREIHVLGGSTTAKVIVKNGITMVALDNLVFYLGAGAGQISGKQALFGQDHKIAIEENSKNAILDGNQVIMPEASFVTNGELYVPLTFVVESLGYLVYWREQTQTIYIQSPKYFAQALEIVEKSLQSVQSKPSVTTNYTNYTNLSSDGPDRYFLESKGTMHTNMKDNIAQDTDTSIMYNGYYDSIQNEPVQTYVSTDSIDSWKNVKYITANGIYYQTDNGSYIKEPVPPENISTMDMATKSVQIDPKLFLYSATIHKDYDNTLSIKAETDIGLLLKVGFDIYMPDTSSSLKWTETYQTIEYDPVTALPKNLKLSLYADCKYGQGDYQKINLGYMHNYTFDFNTPINISLPDGVK